MRLITFLPVFLLAFSACKLTEHDHHQHDAKTPVLKAGTQTFGSAISLKETTTLADILKTPENFQDKEVLTEGVVKTACQKMGCWMELATSMEAEAGCRVTFKDYDIFTDRKFDSAPWSPDGQGDEGLKSVRENAAIPQRCVRPRPSRRGR